jgi:hypothetical protein
LAPGDYDNTTTVDGADFLAWQRTLGITVAAGSGADGNKDGTVNAPDLALWRAGMPAVSPPGDYDHSNRVDGADFLLWQRTLGNTVAAGAGADGNNDGTINAADLAVWKAGMSAPQAATASVPLMAETLGLPINAFLTSDMFDASGAAAPALLEQPVVQTSASTVAADVAFTQMADGSTDSMQPSELIAPDSDSASATTLADSLFEVLAS